MKIVTDREVITVNSQAELNNYIEDFASIDGQNDSQVRSFQLFANSKGEKLRVNGKWNSKTRTAYAKHGAEWEKVYSKQHPNYSPSSPDGKTRAGHFWDKVKKIWVAASEAGLVDQGLNAVSPQTEVNTAMFPDDTAPQKPSVWPIVLIGLAVVGIGYYAYNKSQK